MRVQSCQHVGAEQVAVPKSAQVCLTQLSRVTKTPEAGQTPQLPNGLQVTMSQYLYLGPPSPLRCTGILCKSSALQPHHGVCIWNPARRETNGQPHSLQSNE